MVLPHTVDYESSPASPCELDLPGWPSLARPNSCYPCPFLLTLGLWKSGWDKPGGLVPAPACGGLLKMVGR